MNVRYIVYNVDESIEFYTKNLGFEVVMHPAPTFAILSRENLRLILSASSGPGGGSQPMPDGRTPKPGGWNRFQMEVENLDEAVDKLRKSGANFRNDIVDGIGGRQIILDDPSGNPIELFQRKK